MDTELIREIEERAADAWPAAESEALDGWRLRWHHGVTRRANSVLPNQGGALTLEEKLERVRDFYRRWDAPVRFQLSPGSLPAGLDAFLAARGFRIDAPTCVQTATLADVLRHSPTMSGCRVQFLERPEEEWFSAYRQVEGIGGGAEARRAVLDGIRRPTAYALLKLGEEPATVGLGVADGDWVGVFCMGTLPRYRRRGAAGTVLRALAEWGTEKGATRAYLQVMDDNVPARALYTHAGFSTLYHYWYREGS